MKKQIKKSNGAGILKGKPGSYLIMENVNGKDKVFIGTRKQALARMNPEDLILKKPRLNFSGFPKRIRERIISPAKSYHLVKEDFLNEEDPFDLEPFPEEGVYVLTDIFGNLKRIVPDGPDDEIIAPNDVDGTSNEDSDLPF